MGVSEAAAPDPGPHPSRAGRAARTVRRRGSDRLERASLVVTALLVLLAAPLGVAVGGARAEALRTEAVQYDTRHLQLDVLVLTDARTTPGRQDGMSWTDASWTAPRGEPREGRVIVPTGSERGATVSAWFHPDGDPAPPPPTEQDVIGQGVVVGITAGLGAAALAVAAHALVRFALDRYRMHQWAAEWQSVERTWSGRV